MGDRERYLAAHRQAIFEASLYKAYAMEAYGDRSSTDASHSLDHAFDRFDEALDDYYEARRNLG